MYDKFSGRYGLPGSTKNMSLDEFVQLMQESGVVELDENFGSRELGPQYNLAMMTQKNEIDFDRHLSMQVIEFIEAIGRVADKLALPSWFDVNNLIYFIS